MFDPALLMSLHPPLPPALPPLAIERPWDGSPAITPEAYANLIVGSYAQSITAWERTIAAGREGLLARARGLDTLSPVMLDALSKAVLLLEEIAERKAVEATRFRKRSARSVKRHMAEDPAKGAVSKILMRGLTAQNDRVVQRLLDEALAMRAFRAEYDPEARGGPTFEDPDELERFLLADVA